jgi:hypothetical protein
MSENNHPHFKVIENMKDISPMIALIEDSKLTYIKENISQHLHSSQIKLLKDANKHSKPHHKKVRISQYKKLLENPEQMDNLFELHKKLFIKKYQKLENKGLVEVDTECDDLPYDVKLTQKGIDLLAEIKYLESQWQEIVLNDVEDCDKLLEILKQVTHNALPINYNHKKQQKFVF